MNARIPPATGGNVCRFALHRQGQAPTSARAADTHGLPRFTAGTATQCRAWLSPTRAERATFHRQAEGFPPGPGRPVPPKQKPDDSSWRSVWSDAGSLSGRRSATIRSGCLRTGVQICGSAPRWREPPLSARGHGPGGLGRRHGRRPWWVPPSCPRHIQVSAPEVSGQSAQIAYR